MGMFMKRHLWVLGVIAAFPGCGIVNPGPPEPVPVAVAPLRDVTPLVVAGQTAARLDTTTPAEQAAALAKPAAMAKADLGLMVVALGSPAEAGFWLSGTAVKASGKGRVVTEDGASVAVDLRPGSGGALLSLAAFRALGLGLTDLSEVRVFAD